MKKAPYYSRFDRSDLIPNKVEELIEDEDALEVMQQQFEEMAENARISENRWRPKNRILVAGLMAVSSFAGFLAADYFQLRLFSTSPQPEIDGTPVTELDKSFLRGNRKALSDFKKNLAEATANDDGMKLRGILERAEMARRLAGDDPDKLKELNKYVIGERVSPIGEPRTAKQSNKPLKEVQSDESDNPDSGVDIR